MPFNVVEGNELFVMYKSHNVGFVILLFNLLFVSFHFLRVVVTLKQLFTHCMPFCDDQHSYCIDCVM